MSRWIQRRAGRKSRREQVETHNRVDAFYAAAAGKEPRFQVAIQPKRTRSAPGSDGRKLERAVNDEIYDAVRTFASVQLWRNNRGVAEYGGHKVRYGVGPNGAADWIGYRSILVTQDLVGKMIAQFVAIEAKRPGEKPDDDQYKFLNKVRADGGCASFVTSGDQTTEVLDSWPLK